jgi:hypothetical protein
MTQEELYAAIGRAIDREIVGGSMDRSEINKNRKSILQSFNHYIPDFQAYSGHVDSRAVHVYFKDGEEIARYENGKHTYTPRFKELCHELVNEMLEGKMK